MAIIVYRRPEGHTLTLLIDGTVPVSAVLGGDKFRAIFFVPGHGRTDGQVIYIKSEVENYNGFFYVNVIDADQFSIQSLNKPYAASDSTLDIEFVRAIDHATIYRDYFTHGWNCVHLPIIYRLYNDLWPTNSVDTIRSISSVTDSNGYCNITASGDIKATGSAAALEFVNITSATDDDLNGVWQIITYSSDTSFVLNIPYSSANDTALTGASIQYYYNNYVTKVQVWGGLNNGHEYYGQKPFELLATLDLIPDEDSVCMFSISEILKKQIEIENNLLLGTLPNNLDAWTGFFIKYGEEYDDSDGTTLSRSTVSYTSDMATFEGKAVNSILPFKNVYSGSMSEYVSGDANQKFLTNWERPTIFSGKYFDLGFIQTSDSSVILLQKYYSGSTLIDTSYTPVTSDEGILRLELTEDCDYDTMQVTVMGTDSLAAPSTWTDSVAGWTTKGVSSFTLVDGSWPPSPAHSYTALSVSTGVILRLQITLTVTGTVNGSLGISVFLSDNANNPTSSPIEQICLVTPAMGATTFLIELTATSASTRLQLVAGAVSGSTGSSGSVDLTVDMPGFYSLSTDILSETKTIDINCDCVPSQAEEGIYLSWQNNVGHFDYWFFTAYKDHITDIVDSGETSVNTFPDWPNSRGEFADTDKKKQTYRESFDQLLVRSQHLTKDQLNQIKAIKTSPLVQIVNSIYDRRTVIVDADSFTEYKEDQKLYEITFTITYTDDVPSQRV